MCELQKLKITPNENGGVDIFIDDKELHNVMAYSLKSDPFSIEFTVTLELDKKADIKLNDRNEV